MISADVSVVAGDKGPFYYMLEEFHRHFNRIDVIGLKPRRRVHESVFGNVFLNHPETGKLRQPFYIRDTVRRLTKEREYGFAVSHDYNIFYNGLGAYLARKHTGIPYISEIHHVPGYPRAATLRERADKWCTRLYASWVQKHALAIRVVNAKELPDLLVSWGVKREKIKVLHSLYIDFDTFCPKPADKEYDLIFCGRLASNKGVFLLLEALKIIKEKIPHIRLLMVGRGPLKQRIRDFVAQQGLEENVEFKDWVPEFSDLAELYRRSRVLICPSYNEGGPRVTVEAMACGTPVISTPVGIMQELIEENKNGLFFNWDAGELAQKTLTLLNDQNLYERISANLAPTIEPFERKKIISALAQGFKNLVQ